MMLQVNNLWIQVALRVTEDDGITRGDRTLLRVLLQNQVVLKPNEASQEKDEAEGNNILDSLRVDKFDNKSDSHLT